jgi:hypothetical protein
MPSQDLLAHQYFMRLFNTAKPPDQCGEYQGGQNSCHTGIQIIILRASHTPNPIEKQHLPIFKPTIFQDGIFMTM